MKNSKTLSIISRMTAFFILCAMVLLPASQITVGAENTTTDIPKDTRRESLYTFGDTTKYNTKIHIQTIGGVDTLVLPSTVSADNVTLYYDDNDSVIMHAKGEAGERYFTSGTPINLNNLCAGNDYTLTLSCSSWGTQSEYKLKFIFSKNIPAMYLTSDNPQSNGRPWVEESVDKSNKATGSMVLQKSDMSVVYDDALTQIKGRGNTTWELTKKPYQIKLQTKSDLLETGDKKNASKTWVLLANALDATAMRNSLALNMGKALNMDDNIDSTYVDLYYDGEYRGNYMLTEKVEVGGGRVSVTDLADKNTEANIDIDIEKLPTDLAVTSNGATYKYCVGMNSPEDITGGYLLEMDYKNRALEEVCYFYTTRGQYVVVKSPEFASKEEMDYIASLYQEYEDAVYNNGINPTSQKSYSDYVDAESMACYYLVNEFSKSRDCFKSSAYLHKEAGEDKMYMGPLWDYDMSFGRGGDDYNADDIPSGLIAPESEFNMTLLGIDHFYTTVRNVYESTFYPLIENEILNPDNTGNSIYHYSKLLSQSAMCNTQMWYPDNDWNTEVQKLTDFITTRKEYLKETFDTFSSINNLKKEQYLDILPSAWYYEDITNASIYGFVKGMGDNIFLPEDNVTRSQAIQALYNISKTEDVEYKEYFSDVKPTHWHAQAVTWAVENDICDITDDKMFNPNEEITREEFIDIMHRYQGSPKALTNRLSGYSDASDVSDSRRPAVEWSIVNGLISGYDNKIDPLKNMTRAEFATILVRYYNIFLS